MSGFLKRDRTVNPAGGVNPASSPNVGQYGWTSFDAGNVNQIIEYVNICKEYAERAKDSADYVDSKFDELQGFMNYIEQVYSYIGPIFDNIDLIYKDIVKKFDEITIMHTYVSGALVDSQAAAVSSEKSKKEAEASATAADISAKAAKVSEDAAASSAKDAADTAEELRKGQVYRGTWNLEANNAYPATPDTNSVWDIVLNEGTVDFRFDNKRWFWGDRLLYLKDDNKFSQIESGSTVVSVNGKSGAVTLEAVDVKALPISGGYLTGRAFVDMGASAEPQIGIRRDSRVLFMADNNTVQGMYSPAFTGQPASWLIFRDVATGVTNLGDKRSATAVNGKESTFTYNDKKVYHEGFKPAYTAEDVGAASAYDPRITGSVSVYAGNSHLRLIENDQTPEKVWHMEVSNGNFRLLETNVKAHLDIGANGNFVIGSPAAVKSTLQVGPSATGSNLGATSIRNQMTSLVEIISPADTEHKAGSGIVFHNASSGTAGLVYKQNGGNDSYFNFISDETRWDVRVNNNKVYHEGLKPTAADVGALSLSGGTLTGDVSFVPTVVRSVTDLKSAPFKPTGVANVGTAEGFIPLNHLSARHDGGYITHLNTGLYKKSLSSWDGSGMYVALGGSDGGPTENFVLEYGGNITHSRGYKFYHTSFKPTAAEVGALPISGGTVSGRVALTGQGAGVTLNPPSSSESSYIISTAGGENNWYLGKGGASHDIAFNSYKHGTNIVLASDKVIANKNLYVNSNEVMHKGNLASFTTSGLATINLASATLTANAWADTGVTTKTLSDAIGDSWLLGCVMVFPASGGGFGQYATRIGFTTTCYTALTNSNDAHLIPVSTTSHATNKHYIKLRWQFVSGSSGYAKLQILSEVGGTMSGVQLIVKRLM